MENVIKILEIIQAGEIKLAKQLAKAECGSYDKFMIEVVKFDTERKYSNLTGYTAAEAELFKQFTAEDIKARCILIEYKKGKNAMYAFIGRLFKLGKIKSWSADYHNFGFKAEGKSEFLAAETDEYTIRFSAAARQRSFTKNGHRWTFNNAMALEITLKYA